METLGGKAYCPICFTKRPITSRRGYAGLYISPLCDCTRKTAIRYSFYCYDGFNVVGLPNCKITRTIDDFVQIKYLKLEAICNRIVGLVKYATKEVRAIDDPDCKSVGVFYWAWPGKNSDGKLETKDQACACGCETQPV